MRNKKKQRTIGKKSSPNDVAKVHPKQMKDDQTAGAILELAEPLLNSENNPAEIRFAFSIVIMGWNLSLMDGEKKIRMKETFMENAPKEMQLKDVSYLFSKIGRASCRERVCHRV